jgi:hydrogenase maturation protein HypF
MTQYIGDISTLESLKFEKKAIQKMCDTLNVTRNPDVIACDFHPDYMTSHLSEVISQEQGIELIKTQHHHSHIVSVAAENNIDPTEEILGLALDGAGYGTDGAIWGGEALKSTFYEFERLGHLENIPMPGGDLCTYYPYRMLISALSQVVSDDEIRDITSNHINKALPHKEKELDVILRQIKNKNYIKTSSSGRFLDSISALLDLCYIRTYEGEPAMRLEALADKGKYKHKKIEPLVKKNNRKYVLNTSNILYNLFKMKKTYKIQDIALLGQKYLSDGVINIIKQLSDDTGIKKVALTGGVLVNTYIYKSITLGLNNSNLQVFHNKKIPPGDGGIALGQGCIALKSVI